MSPMCCVDANLLARATLDMQKAFTYPDFSSFTPVWALVVTWLDVIYSAVNATQVINER